MFVSRLIPVSAVAVVAAISLGSVSLSGQSATREEVATAAVSSDAAARVQSAPSVSKPTALTTMARIKAAPMTSSELNAVKGLHVHFVVPGSQNDQYGPTGLHLAGNLFEHNWENLGGTDPAPVAPSYHGLCKAQKTPSPIFIPFNPAIGTQCP